MKIEREGHRRPFGWCCSVAILAAAVLHSSVMRAYAGDGPEDAGSPPATSPHSQSNVSSGPLAATEAKIADSTPKTSAYVVLYLAKEVLAKIRDEHGASETTAQEMLKSLLMVTGPALRPDKVTWTVDGRLVIEASAAGHKQVAATLESIRKIGLTQIAIETRFVAVNRELLRKALPDSTVSPLDVSETSPAECIDVRPAGLDLPLGSHEGTRVVRAQCVVEKSPPLRFRVMEKEQGKECLQAWQDDRQTNLLQAPKITVFSGQTGCVSDTSQTPFVVGLKKLDGDAQEPQIRIVSEGTTLQVRPTAVSSGVIHLDFSAKFSKIQKVETACFEPGSSDGKLVGKSVQIPEVATVRIEGGADLRSGQWLLLCGWNALDQQFVDGEPEPASWMDWLSDGKRFKAREIPELALMVRVEMIQPSRAASDPASTPAKTN